MSLPFRLYPNLLSYNWIHIQYSNLSACFNLSSKLSPSSLASSPIKTQFRYISSSSSHSVLNPRSINRSSGKQKPASNNHFRYNTTTTTTRAMSTIVKPSSRIESEKESVWNEFIELSLAENPKVNLGQGLPDYPEAAPDHIKQHLVQAVSGTNYMLNQYTRGYGHPRLVKVIAELYSKLIGRNIKERSEVLVTIGAYESIFCIINAYIDKGDEVIIIEPFFDCYEPMTRLAGGSCRFVPLRLRKRHPESTITSADWVLDRDELEAAVGPKTKMLILNTPHNPIGKVFSRQELQVLADICQKHNIMVLSDEVYEHLVIDGEHVRIASLPGMWERTITVGSAGKTFSVTGWKLGWCYGPESLMRHVCLFHQNCIYTCPTPIQEAVAMSFETELKMMGHENSYWTNLAASLRGKRDSMVAALKKANMEPTVPEGGYFLLADTSAISQKYDLTEERGDTKDHKLARYLTKHKKFQGIPPSAFYSGGHKNLAEDYIRLCYFKKESTLKLAEQMIEEL